MRYFPTRSAALAGMLLLVGWAAVSAQQKDPAESGVPDPAVDMPESVSPDPQVRIPEQTYPCNPGGFEPSDKLGEPSVPPSVDDCDGVIPPPPTQDTEMRIEPPDPDAGTLPIIEPDEINPG